MGLNITAYKNQVKHYREAASAMEEWNQKMIAGATNINAFNNATVQNNAHLKAYLQTTSVQAPASLEGYKVFEFSDKSHRDEVYSLLYGVIKYGTK